MDFGQFPRLPACAAASSWSRFEKAARAWGKAHGYIVIPSLGAGEEAWGVQ